MQSVAAMIENHLLSTTDDDTMELVRLLLEHSAASFKTHTLHQHLTAQTQSTKAAFAVSLRYCSAVLDYYIVSDLLALYYWLTGLLLYVMCCVLHR
jgi:hypothetical protein